jgi:dTDP-4-dehydrorhamnose 3,5-epimerase-like enzyme
MISALPTLLEGNLVIDDRGELAFVNETEFSEIRRYYLVSNHRSGQVRAWHAHRSEGKCAMAVSGSALVCAVRVTNWRRPRKDQPVHRFVLSASQPAVLVIPAGYANGWMSLTDDAKLLWLSTVTVEESRGDDVRFPARYWDAWKVEER